MRTSEAAIQNACHGRLRKARIGTGVHVTIPEDKAEQPPPVSHHRHKQSRQTGRKVIQCIIQPRCATTELAETFIPVTYHRVQGIHHLVSHHGWKAPDSIIKQRRHHPVAQVLRHGLQYGSINLFGSQFRRIAPHNPRQPLPACLQSLLPQSPDNLPALLNQAPVRQSIKYKYGSHQHRTPHPHRLRTPCHTPTCCQHPQRINHSYDSPFQETAPPLVPLSLNPSYQIPEQHHRMGQPPGVSQ